MSIHTKKYGVRSSKEDIKRIIALMILVLFIFIVNSKYRQVIVDENNIEFIKSDNWAYAFYRTPDRVISIPEKSENKKRIIYISNSHAKTGGHVANHLQEILDLIEPEGFEVFDMSDPGIFTPDILQRAVLSLEFNPDLIILGLAYISFSDRMKLSMQAHSVRSFFKKDIFPKLSIGFWLRNYDIGIYTDTFVAHHLSIYRYRNYIRDIWERRVANTLKSVFGNDPILFLEIDENQGWKFPDGYDKNLFQWDLYAIGRDNHISDLQEAVDKIEEENIPIIAFNTPIHWEKSVNLHDHKDYELYQRELNNIFSNVMKYIDYQDKFPKEFSTYDALHPMWHGARLHALDIVLKLNQHFFIDKKIDDEEINNYFVKDKTSTAYVDTLNFDHPNLSPDNSLIRYDIFEPDNAAKLINILLSYYPGSNEEKEFLYDLSLRLRYWLEIDFISYGIDENLYDEHFSHAIINEIKEATKRASLFKERLIELQQKKLESTPIPDLGEAQLVSTKNQNIINAVELIYHHYQLENKNEVTVISDTDQRIIAYTVYDYVNQRFYQRVDILGDGSFILLQNETDLLMLPSWVENSVPFVQFGI